MEAQMQVAKWGNSLAIRLPARLVAKLGLAEGDEVEIVKASGKSLAITKVEKREQALQKLRAMRGLVPADYKFIRSDAHDE
jgi:antitoxin MazE